MWLAQRRLKVDSDARACVVELRAALCEKSKSKSTAKFSELLAFSDPIQDMFQSFLKECESKSEVCQYWQVFQQMALNI